ncbi:MAG: bifunctional phosphoribosyl-AMP cyclohydrolase/phosphoribosyl-ATP diphosphatase HisIE [Chitinophagaceae bacterium]|jgi:phosphoribosyl-ATP pyrophosphohydrolase/phosphoribosyl-AMP cyclohydrolase|nr:bifunctional phosphoribosyl-AMP cyclohydrolase/phosphoribosyl-ATP diphosphatase HisIE [Chitinophagaceae bacterium]
MQPDFKKYADGLVPAIIQDYKTQKVLMLGFMNEEALKKTEQTGQVSFYSRSKKRIWTKGEESGNYLKLKQILTDCDNDSLLIRAEPLGPVCHTGSDTCWSERNHSENFLLYLEEIIALRRNSNDENSYVYKLFKKGLNKIAQKVGEEAVELIIEAKDVNKDLFLNEAADLLFHFLILLQSKNATLNEVTQILKDRHGHR